MHAEFTGLGHEAHYFWHMRWLENTYEKAMTSGDGSRIGNVMELPRNFHQNEAMNEWEQNEESLGIFTFAAEAAIDYVDRMISEGRFDKIDHNAPGPDDIRAIGGLTFVMARTTHGEIGYSLPGVVENPPAEDMETLERFAGVFDLAYRRFEDLLDAEKRAYESTVETSLERVRGMAAAMNHSDDLMQIAEAMFKEMEILKINPLRYGIAMIDGEKKEAELWASTVNDGHYLDMLGIIPLEWHPMLKSAYEAWSAQHEELIYKLEGKELSDYYQKIGPINPEIPDLESLQNPETSKVQYCSFFPFNHGILYAFTDGEPGEEGCSILKRFSSAFEQAHIRYHDLQKAELQARQIREERDRLEVALKELRATQEQLVQQEKLASLGQLTAGIAHEIKNPLNFVNNFSDLSLELVEEIREELRQWTGGDQSHLRQGSGGQGKTKSEKGENPLLRGDGIAEGDGRGVSDGADDSEHSQSNDAALGSANTPLNPSASWRREAGLSPDPDLILDILNDIEANLKTIHKHGSRADSIVKSMLQHSRGGDGKMEPTPLNPLIKEYVNLAFHGMRAGKDPINVDIDLQLDENVGEVPVIAEDFSRVILNLTNNAFDAMREKVTEDGRPETVEDTLRQPTESGKAERSRGVSSIDEYTPKLSVRTKSDGNTITIEIEDNGHGIPDDMKDKILQPFFTTKKGTAGTGLGLSITNDIIKAHGGYLSIPESDEAGTTFRIELKATE
jgi:signal transduction histidine kinase